MARKAFIGNVLVLVSGTAISQSLVVLAAPILTRLYSPKDFGVLSLYISILSFFSLIGTAQYENAIPMPEDDGEAINLVTLSFFILLVICFTNFIALWLGKAWISRIFQAPELVKFLWLMPLSLFGMGIFNILYRWHMRRRSFNVIAKTKVTQSLGMITTQILGGMVFVSPVALFIGDVIGRIAGSGRLVAVFLKEEGYKLRKVKLSGLLLVIKRFKRFPILSGWSALLKEGSDQLPSIYVAMAYGPEVVGWFMLVHRTLGLPLSWIGYSVGNVYMAEALELLHERAEERKVKQLYWRTLRNLLFFSLPVMMTMALVAKWAFPLIFGTQWAMAGKYLLILLPMYQLQFLAIPVAQTLYVLERQDLQLVREAIRLLLLLLVFVAFDVSIGPEKLLTLIAGAGSIAFLVNLFTSWLALDRFKA